jgi:phytoene dehydrogenase-like protein
MRWRQLTAGDRMEDSPVSSYDVVVIGAGHNGLACASYPSRFADGSSWQQRGEAEAHRLLQAIEERAPGFTDSITGLAWRHAEDWERETGLLGGHPMHLDITLDQVGPFRPLPELATHRTPIARLYLSGAGMFPTGGVSAVPGRTTAKALLSDLRKRR